MEGFHYSGSRGTINFPNQEFAHLDLPPGKYIVFASVEFSISSATASALDETAYVATLEFGSVKDDRLGALRYDVKDPGSRFESIALNVAAETDSPIRASLILNATTLGVILVWNPRLSAIQLDDLHIQTDSDQLNDSERQALESQILATSARAGIPMHTIAR